MVLEEQWWGQARVIVKVKVKGESANSKPTQTRTSAELIRLKSRDFKIDLGSGNAELGCLWVSISQILILRLDEPAMAKSY